MSFKSGFVTIIGKPNVGKSTLMNCMVGQKLSIVTPKASTTRHRILGVASRPEGQIVFSDTPGIIKSSYKLHDAMMDFVWSALDDSDLIIYLLDIKREPDLALLERIQKTGLPVLAIVNKIDLSTQEEVESQLNKLSEHSVFNEIIPISALHGFDTEKLFSTLLAYLPEGMPFFPEDQITDRAERFFISEIIREQLFTLFSKEIPYSCEVVVEDYKDMGERTDIRAFIMVERSGQKGILIGKGGKDIKKIGVASRKAIEAFIDKHVFLDLRIKVAENWRKKDLFLRRFGYK